MFSSVARSSVCSLTMPASVSRSDGCLRPDRLFDTIIPPELLLLSGFLPEILAIDDAPLWLFRRKSLNLLVPSGISKLSGLNPCRNCRSVPRCGELRRGRARPRTTPMSASRTPSETKPPRMEPLARLPLFYALKDKRALVSGTNAGAVWKVELLSATGARVEVYAEAPSDDLIALSKDA